MHVRLVPWEMNRVELGRATDLRRQLVEPGIVYRDTSRKREAEQAQARTRVGPLTPDPSHRKVFVSLTDASARM